MRDSLFVVIDAQNLRSTGALTESFAEAFLAAIGPWDFVRSPLCVLDVGTGTARIPIEICRQRRGIEMTAVDRGSAILRRARRRVALAGLEDAIHIDQADACELPYAAHSFDAVISNGLVHHVSDRSTVLREMVRVLRPGGLLFIRDSLPQADAATIVSVLTRTGGSPKCPSDCVRPLPGALTIDDARDLASAAGLPAEWVRPTGSRHWLLAGRVDTKRRDEAESRNGIDRV